MEALDETVEIVRDAYNRAYEKGKQEGMQQGFLLGKWRKSIRIDSDEELMEAKELQHKIRMVRLSLEDDYGDKDMEDEAIFNAGHKEGMQVVVDWVGEYGRMTYAKATGEVTFDHINYTNFLKEKGLK